MVWLMMIDQGRWWLVIVMMSNMRDPYALATHIQSKSAIHGKTQGGVLMVNTVSNKKAVRNLSNLIWSMLLHSMGKGSKFVKVSTIFSE